MAILRTDVERALDELVSQEEGMRFQGLAVVLGKKRWPQLIARQRKKDFGLDAYAPSSLTPEKIGKGLAASITPTLKKISDDASTAKKNFPDLRALLFVTPAKVGNADRNRWVDATQKDHSLELHIIEREEIITLMMLPENASLGASFLNLDTVAEPNVADIIERTRRAADAVAQMWAAKVKGYPLIDLNALRVDSNGTETADVLSVEQIDQALLESRRIVLEGPAGRGKTTTLIQIASRARATGTPFIVELPAWTSSRRGILEFISGMPAFQAEGLTATDLARVQRAEPFMFLLNGWNEIAESNSAQATDSLRVLERDFPSAGIIVATRTHHLTPPLPGATRLRLLRLRRAQRTAYVDARLGEKCAELRARIVSDPSLDDLTRTPFILSEVVSLFEAGAKIPSTKIGVLAQVVHLQEKRDEHRNALQATPIFGLQSDYLKAFATEMTHRGAVALTEPDARSLTAASTKDLVNRGQIDQVGAPAILATLTAHHVLERAEYPHTTFQFEHQQLQEYYAALDIRTQLLEMQSDDHDTTGRFTADYANNPAWAEPLRMIAEWFAEWTGDGEADMRNILAGRKLVEMALTVDLVFAGELAWLCGPAIWNEVRAVVSQRFRSAYAIHEGNFRQYAIAAMLSSGADDFSDIIVPLLSGQDEQTRLRTYRLWPDIHVSSLGVNWRKQVSSWREEARASFVSELLHHRIDSEIATFAAEDDSIAVKKAAVSGLMWTGSDDLLAQVLDSMDTQTFEEVARQNADRMPAGLRSNTIAAMRKYIENGTDHPACLRTALNLISFGETGMDNFLKKSMAALIGGEMRNLGPHYIQPALEQLSKTDPAWVSEWVATQIVEGGLYEHDYWLPFATAIPSDLIEKYLQRIGTEDLSKAHIGGMNSVVAACADNIIATRIFVQMRELQRKIDSEQDVRHDHEWTLVRQLEAVFRKLPDNIAADGILSSVSSGDPLDIKIATRLLSKVARSEAEPLSIVDEGLRARLRNYLKSSLDLVMHQDDFSGKVKANLASSIAQVGRPSDIADLVSLIHADLERIRHGRAARAAGDRGPLGNGGATSYARWHITAVMQLDPTGAAQVLVDLLAEPEYRSDVAAEMARNFIPKSDRSYNREFRYNQMWAAREGLNPPIGDQHLRTLFADTIKAEMVNLKKRNQDGEPADGLTVLAKALAAIDARRSAPAILEVVSKPGQWDQYTCLETAELLLINGVVLPANTVFALVESFLERTDKWMEDQDRYLLRRILALCPFVDDPEAGIEKIRDVLGMRRLYPNEMPELVSALGESRSDAAVDFLFELASDAPTFRLCQGNFINGLAALDTQFSNELLQGFVDPDVRSIASTLWFESEDLLVMRLAELAERRPEVAKRLNELCECDLPELNLHFISKIMGSLGTTEALAANLQLIDDTKRSPVPQGVWDQVKSAFIEHRSYGENSHTYKIRARAANDLRMRLFRMALDDPKRQKSASLLLGKIELWRIEYGRPPDEVRHPDLASGTTWPPTEV